MRRERQEQRLNESSTRGAGQFGKRCPDTVYCMFVNADYFTWHQTFSQRLKQCGALCPKYGFRFGVHAKAGLHK